MKTAICVLSIALTVQLVLLVFFFVKHSYSVEQEKKRKQEETVAALEHTVEALQHDSIKRLIEHVKKVMAGEIVYESGTNPLSLYSYHEEFYPTMASVETDLNIIEISLDGSKGEIKAVYFIRYLDSYGDKIMGTGVDSHLPAIWALEKQGEDWVIIDIVEGKHALFQ